MEKFYICNCKKYLDAYERFGENVKNQRSVVADFLDSHGIKSENFYVRGDGCVNSPFYESEKENIVLYISDSEESERAIGNQLRKPRIFDDGTVLRPFKKSSKLLKEFQDLCIEEKIVINIWRPRVGDYFKELYLGGYSTTQFVLDGKRYLRIDTDKYDSITPAYDGFEEIKGSEFYLAVEQYEDKNS